MAPKIFTSSSASSNNSYSFVFVMFGLLTVISLLFSTFQAVSCGGSAGNTTSTTVLINVDLIHRDSPHSPLYNSSQTPFERFHSSIQRSFTRAASITNDVQHNNNYMNITSLVSPDHNQYLMKFSIGTPPLQIFALVDTGSNLVWIQCRPCKVCYKQRLPIFDPITSTTYEDLPCDSESCQALQQLSSNTTTTTTFGSGYFSSSSCEGDHVPGRCKYSYGYLGSSSTEGYLGLETLTFDSTMNGIRVPVRISPVSFGCGHDNRGDYNQNWSGIVGLGGGSLSLVSQLGSAIQSKFSYCLVPQSYSTSTSDDAIASNPMNPSKLTFGGLAEMSEGEGVVSTSMFPNSAVTTSYQLVYEAISIGNIRIDVPSTTTSSSLGQQIIVIDSGTTLTYLPPGLYQVVEEELKRAVHAELVWSPSKDLSVCYRADDALKLPNITFHFIDGANVELPPSNTFIEVPSIDEGKILCFGFSTTFYDISIYGNVAQTNFLIEFDAEKRIVKFKKTDCTQPR